MPKLKALFALSLILLTNQAISGTRGLRVVLLSIEDTDFFDSQAYVAFRDGEAPRLPAAQDCWNHRATGGESLSHTTRKKLPAGMTRKLGQAIWNGDMNAVTTAQKIMRSGDQYAGSNGYDGMFIVRVRGATIQVLGIGVNTPPGSASSSEKIEIPWNKKDPMGTASNFDFALCKAAKPMDYKFNP